MGPGVHCRLIHLGRLLVRVIFVRADGTLFPETPRVTVPA